MLVGFVAVSVDGGPANGEVIPVPVGVGGSVAVVRPVLGAHRVGRYQPKTALL